MPDAIALRRSVHQRVVAQVRERRDPAALRLAVADAVSVVAPLLDREARVALIGDCLDDLVGFGPFEPYLRDETVTEVLYNGGGVCFVERSGQLESVRFCGDDADALRSVQRMLAPLGLRLDRSAPMVDARLPDGSRVHAVIPPLAVDGPAISIRRFPDRGLGIDAFGVAPALGEWLAEAVRARRTILVAGATGSGKTTLLNALAGLVAAGERIVSIEETAELALRHPHVVRLEARRPNTEGVGRVDVRDLVRAALRMRPDRIVVGEVRGGEAFDMLQACTTGHAGSFSTVHANSAAEALDRLETLALMADTGVPHAALRRQVRSAIDVVVFVARRPDGTRRVEVVVEVVRGHDGATGEPRAVARHDGGVCRLVPG